MNIIETVKDIINNYPEIAEFSSNIHVDYTDSEPTNFGISSMGDTLLREDVLGNQLRQHNFVLYAINQAYTDFDRLTNSNFLLNLSYYLEKQKGQIVTAVIDDATKTGKILSIFPANGMLFSIPTGDINDGVNYQLQINVQYSIKEE